MHSKELRLHGDRELRLYHVPVWRESPLFDAREKAALEWAERLTKVAQADIEDEHFQAIREFFSEKEVSDLSIAIGTINLWNRLGVAFRSTIGALDKVMGLDKAGLK